MKYKSLLIAILVFFLSLNFLGGSTKLYPSSDIQNISDTPFNQITIGDENNGNDQNHSILDVLIVNSIFENITMSEINILVNFIGTDSLIHTESFQSNNNGRLNILYSGDLSKLETVQITLPNNQRYFFNTVDFSYPEEIPDEYTLKINDKLVTNYVTKEEIDIFSTNTIIMKEYFNFKDMNDKQAWEYLLTDETVNAEVQKILIDKSLTLEQYIDDLFLDISIDERKDLWKKYNERINNGVNNYVDMLNSKAMKDIININFYHVKAFDNIYTSYICAGSFDIRELDELNNAINSLEIWKRDSGKERGYVFYDKNIYFNIHIRKLDSELY